MTYTDYDANTDTLCTHIGADESQNGEVIILESVSSMFEGLVFCQPQAD